MKRTIAAAVATVGIAGALQHAVLPQHDLATPETQQHELQREYAIGRQGELEQYRLNITSPAATSTGEAEDHQIARELDETVLRRLIP